MGLKACSKDSVFVFCRKVGSFLEKVLNKYYVVWVVAVFLISFFVKITIISSSTSLGADYGTYLRWADVLRGVDVVGMGLRYPPLYPALLNVFLLFLDEITALKTCAAFLYSAIAIPYFFVAKKASGHGAFALAVSLLIVFNSFYSEMMGWGGNANFLGMIFLTTFLIFWTNSLQNFRSRKDEILAAFFLSLAIGSHYLLAGYVIIFFIVFLSLNLMFWHKNLRDKNFRSLVKTVLIIASICLVLSLPYLPNYKVLLDSAAVKETNFALADQQSIGVSLYLLYKNLFNIAFLSLGIAGIILSYKKGRQKQFSLTLAALIISGALPMLFTMHPARWTYFWPVPIFLGFIIFIKDILSQLKKFHATARTAVAVGMALLIFVYIFNSAIYLYETSSYYNVLSPSTLEALKYIRNNTSVSSIIATSGPYRRGGEGSGHNYGWWIEGFADRKCVATAYLRFLIYYDERVVAESANILFSGTDVLMNSFVMVAETFPAGLGNPELGVNIGDFYDKVLFFADNETIFTFNSNRNVTLNNIKSEVTSVTHDDKGAISVKYQYESLTVLKRISLTNKSTVEVIFEVNHINVTNILIPIFRSDFASINNYYEEDDGSIALEVKTSMGALFRLNITLDYNGCNFNKTYFKQTSEKWQKFAMFVFSNPPPNVTISFKFAFSSSGFAPVKYFKAYDLINQQKIRYFLINKGRLRELEWFTNDALFKKYYENEEIAIFEFVG
jgi:hypothetical protein